jgi:hypothetical protein
LLPAVAKPLEKALGLFLALELNLYRVCHVYRVLQGRPRPFALKMRTPPYNYALPKGC